MTSFLVRGKEPTDILLTRGDLRGIHALLEQRSIDGLYTLSGLNPLRADLRTAADRLRLTAP